MFFISSVVDSLSIGIIVPTPPDTAKKIVSHSSLFSAIIPILLFSNPRFIRDVPNALTFCNSFP